MASDSNVRAAVLRIMLDKVKAENKMQDWLVWQQQHHPDLPIKSRPLVINGVLVPLNEDWQLSFAVPVDAPHCFEILLQKAKPGVTSSPPNGLDWDGNEERFYTNEEVVAYLRKALGQIHVEEEEKRGCKECGNLANEPTDDVYGNHNPFYAKHEPENIHRLCYICWCQAIVDTLTPEVLATACANLPK
jgi:hypothetical protein